IQDGLHFFQPQVDRHGEQTCQSGTASATMSRLDSERNTLTLGGSWWPWKLPVPVFHPPRTP
ncbi:MAG: hypothetical protein ACK56I_17955, partial [bacterium]